MSFFSRLFGGNNQPQVPAESKDLVERPEIRESDFIDTTDPNGEDEKVIAAD